MSEVVPATGIRKIIAERMTESWHTSPRVVYNISVDVTNMKTFRKKLNEEYKEKGTKISYNHILMKICAQALTEFPYVNASFDGNNIVLHKSVNIGLAVSIENGLMVPNSKDVHEKSFVELVEDVERLIDGARKMKLNYDDITGGTFTITNLGMYGMETFSPIINQPEVAILGVNAMTDKPVVIDGEITIRPIMNLSLVADHRVIDGALAAQFIARIKELVENPNLLEV